MPKKVDCLDLFVRKMEEIRPTCPIGFIEDIHTKCTDLFINLTPSIPLCPCELATCSGIVKCAVTKEPLSEVSVTLNGLEVLTDPSGSYTFEDTIPGKYTLAFVKEGFKEVSMAIELKGGFNTFDVNLVPTAVPEASVAFTVVDADTERPLAGVTVNLVGTTRTTDSSGKCQFTGITEGDYPISFSKEGYESYEDTVSFHPY